MIRSFLLPVIVFLLFIIEGTVMQIIAPDRFGSDFMIIPRFAFLVVIVIGIFFGRSHGTIYALLLGLFQDVIYTTVLGVYLFSMGLIAYLVSAPFKLIKKNLFLLMITAVLAAIFLEYLIYGLYSVVGIASLSHERFFYERLLPSIIVNSVFLVLFAFPLRKLMLFLLTKKEDVEEKINKRKRDFRKQR